MENATVEAWNIIAAAPGNPMYFRVELDQASVSKGILLLSPEFCKANEQILMMGHGNLSLNSPCFPGKEYPVIYSFSGTISGSWKDFVSDHSLLFGDEVLFLVRPTTHPTTFEVLVVKYYDFSQEQPMVKCLKSDSTSTPKTSEAPTNSKSKEPEQKKPDVVSILIEIRDGISRLGSGVQSIQLQVSDIKNHLKGDGKGKS